MLLLLLTTLALSISTCLSQTCIPPAYFAHVMFLQDDTDADGILHLNELIATLHIFDTNGDGRVSRHEYTEHQIAVDPSFGPMAHALYDAYDANGDHHLDLTDYTTFYRAIDTDGNDSVSQAEYVHYWALLICHIGHHHNSFCMDQCQ